MSLISLRLLPSKLHVAPSSSKAATVHRASRASHLHGFPFCLQSENVFCFWEIISFYVLFLYKIRNSEPPRNPGEKQEGCVWFAFFEVIISKPQLVGIAPQWMGLERWGSKSWFWDHVSGEPEHVYWDLISPSVEWDSLVFRVSLFSLSLFPSTLPLSSCLPWQISVNQLSSSSPLSLDAVLESFRHGPPESHQQSTGIVLGAETCVSSQHLEVSFHPEMRWFSEMRNDQLPWSNCSQPEKSQLAFALLVVQTSGERVQFSSHKIEVCRKKNYLLSL